MIDTRLAVEQFEFARSLTTAVQRVGDGSSLTASPQLWAELARIGFLGLCSPGVGGTALDLACGMEALGAACCPGPLIAASAASVALGGELLDRLVAGDLVVTLTDGRHIPWCVGANLVLQLSSDGAWIVEVENTSPVPTLSGEPWSIGRVRRIARTGDAQGPIALGELAKSAYLLGAAVAIVDRAAEHARSRVQFRHPIGDFQAVAHPLARSVAEVRATLELVRLVARRDELDVALARRVGGEAARNACVAAERAHQAFGAVGFAVESGVATLSTRIRQWAALPVG